MANSPLRERQGDGEVYTWLIAGGMMFAIGCGVLWFLGQNTVSKGLAGAIIVGTIILQRCLKRFIL